MNNLGFRVARGVFAAALVLGLASPSAAQLAGKQVVPLGGPELGAPVQGMDSGYDPVNHLYLVVSSYINAWGWFVNVNGNIVAGPFLIKQGGGGSFAPRVKYSPHVNSGQGGFLVTYGEEGPRNQNILHGRIISFPGVVGPETTISEGTAYPWIIAGSAAISYSTASQVFLVVWMTTGPGLPLMARTVGVTGAPISAQFRLSTDVGLYPGVSWNSSNDRFGVSFRDEGSAGYGAFAIVNPAGGVEAIQRFQPVVGQQGATDIDYNPDTGRYVMAWFAQPSGGAWEARAAEVDTSANVVASGLLYSKAGGIGFSSLSLAFNPVSRTFLAATLETVGALDPVLGFELNRNGVRTGLSYVAQGILARNTRVSSSSEASEWNVAFNHDTRTAVNVVVTTSSTGGGPAGTFSGGSPAPSPSPSPTPPPPSSSCPTTQPAPGWVCVNGGWLPPGMVNPTPSPAPPPAPAPAPAPSSSCPTVRPAPDWVCINGNWLPPGLAPVVVAPPPAPAPAPAPTPSSSSCQTVQPASDWVCTNGNWVPPGLACPTVQPGPNWTCRNGDWLPPGLAPAAPAPVPSSPAPSSSSCQTVKPASDWICINGNWLPPGLACPTVQPGPNWTCRNGDWLPPGMVFNRTNPLDVITDMPALPAERRAVAITARQIADRRTATGRA